MTIKTIDINARTWFDKVNGNSYFSAIVVLNYGTPEAKELKLPFQYGYGSCYEQAAMDEIIEARLITDNGSGGLYSYCKDNNIILRSNNQQNCLKREVVNFVK
jgi:hypothetical protein